MKLKKLIRVYQFNDYPKKVLFFKRSKWQKQRRYFLRSFYKKYYAPFYRKYFSNGKYILLRKRKKPRPGSKGPLLAFKRVGCSRRKSINYISRFYKNNISRNIILKNYLNVSLRENKTKKAFLKDVQKDKIFKYFYNTANILKTNYQIVDYPEIKKLSSEKKLKVNKKKISGVRELKKGALLENQKITKSIKINKEKRRKKHNLYTFYQYDAYLQSTIIVKDLKKLGNKDFSLISSQYLKT